MDYEELLRRVYQCGRSGAKGADADYYWKMERALVHMNDPNWGKSKIAKENDFRSAFMEVKNYVRNALKDGVNKVYYSLQEKESQLLDGFIVNLNNISFFDKDRLDSIITESINIFDIHGLKM